MEPFREAESINDGDAERKQLEESKPQVLSILDAVVDFKRQAEECDAHARAWQQQQPQTAEAKEQNGFW